jgi:DNA-binding response OmpR family regulator
MRILLAEDDDRIARDVGAALGAAGYVVEREADG